MSKKQDEKQKFVDDYVKKVNLYEKQKPINIDLRAFARYVRENHLSNDMITPETVKMFERSIRLSQAKECSEKIGIPVLTREDVSTLKSGAILASETKYFEDSYL